MIVKNLMHQLSFKWPHKLYSLAIILIPLLYMLVSCGYVFHAGYYFPTDVDPEFNYLFNGITLAHFKFHLNAIGHPGTPVQCLIAITARIVHLFRPGLTLWDDVMLHPWVYIKATVIVAAIINSFFIYLLAHKVFRYTNNIAASFFLQTAPFTYLIVVESSYRLLPELIMPAIICCWMILLVKLLNDKQPAFQKHSVWFALLVGFSLAGKLTFLPFFLLPLFLLPGFRMKMKYAILALLSFLLFAFPVLFNFQKFSNWLTGIISHKGVYGGGEKGFLDVPLFLANMDTMINQTLLILIFLGLLLIVAVYMFVAGENKIAIKMAFGLIVLYSIQYIITAKHYAFYYLTPSLILFVFLVFLLTRMLEEGFPALKKTWIPSMWLFGFGLAVLIHQLPRTYKGIQAINNRQLVKAQALQLFEPYMDNKPKIVVPDYYGCSSIEYALLFGIHESGRYGKELTAIMEKHYPETVVFMPWNGYFYIGNTAVDPREFLDSRKKYTVFMAGYSKKQRLQLQDSLGIDTSLCQFEMQQYLQSTREAVLTFTIK